MNKNEWIIRRMCIEKESLSREEADSVVDKFAKRGIVLYWYRCPFCMRYHMSRQESSIVKMDIIGGGK